MIALVAIGILVLDAVRMIDRSGLEASALPSNESQEPSRSRFAIMGISAGTHPIDRSCRNSSERGDPFLRTADILDDHRDMTAGGFAGFLLNPKARLETASCPCGADLAAFHGIARSYTPDKAGRRQPGASLKLPSWSVRTSCSTNWAGYRMLT